MPHPGKEETLSNLIEEVPSHCRGGGLHNFLRSLPTYTILRLYDLERGQ